MGDKALVCWKCGASLKDVPRPITRRSNCLECYAELHVCVMCKSFDSRYPNRCSDERADPPVHKDSANFCEFYKPLPNAFDAGQDRESKQAEAKLQALFGAEDDPADTPEGSEAEKQDQPKTEEEKAREELEKLFKR